MEHKEIKHLISSWIDGELDASRRRLVEEHLRDCPECRQEFQEMKQLGEIMNNIELKEPKKEVWETYWSSVYNRLERRIGWILLSIGGIILLFFGAYKLVEGVIIDATIPLVLKGGILAALAGVAVLLVSLLKEQLFTWKRERYREVDK